MRRALLAQEITAAAPNHVVIAGLGTSGRAWRDHGGQNPTFYGSDPMGAAPAMALGMALSRPDLDFVLLEGDGDLMMNLSSLAALSDAAPANLWVVVFNNGRYETGGGQPLAAGDRLDLAAIGLGVGLPSTATLARDADRAQVSAALSGLFGGPAPGLLVAAVDPEPSPYGGPGEDSGVEARVRFSQALSAWGSRKAAAQ